MLSVIWPTNVLKTFIESVNAVQEDVKIVFKQDGLFANVIDASHVCFVGIDHGNCSHTCPRTCLVT